MFLTKCSCYRYHIVKSRVPVSNNIVIISEHEYCFNFQVLELLFTESCCILYQHPLTSLLSNIFASANQKSLKLHQTSQMILYGKTKYIKTCNVANFMPCCVVHPTYIVNQSVSYLIHCAILSLSIVFSDMWYINLLCTIPIVIPSKTI